MKKLFSLLLAAALALLTISPAFGAGEGKSKAKKAPTKEPVISSVTPNSITVNDGTSTKTLTINQFTEITVNGRKAGVADLKPKMKVDVALGTDPSKASRISATDK